ncbi:MAG TPA: BatA domain-containing protein, partial [Verrucomicrobiales bacterium]|nr:BatA domain-containing protein [Verrucomicrobiales bacterium]
MPLIFANPLGFWALLGIPAVLLIHFLQRESRRLPISTLFLLEHIDRESVKGRQFDRLRQSIPLWLQLLGVMILTWLLAEPRWTSARSVQRVVLVIDSSASMEAFAEEVDQTLREKIPPLTALVGTTEYSLIESAVTGANLYRGTSFEEM